MEGFAALGRGVDELASIYDDPAKDNGNTAYICSARIRWPKLNRSSVYGLLPLYMGMEHSIYRAKNL